MSCAERDMKAMAYGYKRGNVSGLLCFEEYYWGPTQASVDAWHTNHLSLGSRIMLNAYDDDVGIANYLVSTCTTLQAYSIGITQYQKEHQKVP